jgi:hypothetical protein
VLADLTKHCVVQKACEAPPHVLFPQLLAIVQRYIAEKVEPLPPTRRVDAFLAPCYGWIVERLLAAIHPVSEAGEAPEVPDLDCERPCATTDINVFTAKQVRAAVRSHVWRSSIRSGRLPRQRCWTSILWSARTSRTMSCTSRSPSCTVASRRNICPIA